MCILPVKYYGFVLFYFGYINYYGWMNRYLTTEKTQHDNPYRMLYTTVVQMMTWCQRDELPVPFIHHAMLSLSATLVRYCQNDKPTNNKGTEGSRKVSTHLSCMAIAHTLMVWRPHESGRHQQQYWPCSPGIFRCQDWFGSDKRWSVSLPLQFMIFVLWDM